MNTFIFDEFFLTGLYLYVRQSQLSVDRVICNKWEAIVDFFDDRIAAEDVLNSIHERTGVEFGAIQLNVSDRPKVFRLIPRIFMRKLCLTSHQLEFIVNSIGCFSRYLQNSEAPSDQDLVELRMDLYLSEQIIGSRLKRYSDDSLHFVEHLNQSQELECKSIKELLGRDWPDYDPIE
ncbi:hypothetical protein A9Q81_06820 [Gammaproteobacteria bacterium 42_54_T18]|nr:hypothetical protein A9Q81_06820 [Gammaproteobacteria bacterium 42_54_T18]